MASRPQKAQERPLELRPKQSSRDPKRQVEQLLENGMESAQVWQLVRTSGYYYLLSNAVLTAPLPGQKLEEGTMAYQQMQGALERLMAGDPDAPASAISVHDKPGGWANAAQGVICQPSRFLDPSLAVVIAADMEDLEAHMARLREPMAGQDSNEDSLAAAQWVAENLMAPYPGWKFAGPLPVRLASEIKPGESWREVFLTQRCLELPALEVLPAVRAARVGLQIPAIGGEATTASGGQQWRQWDWEEQDRKQDRRLAAMTCFRFPGTAEEIPKALSDAESYRAHLRAAEEASRARQARLDTREARHRARLRFQWMVTRLMLVAITQPPLQT